MGKFIDLTGEVINNITFIKTAGRSTSNRIKWLARCYCGREFETTANQIKTGKTKSCGCAKNKHGGSRTKLYRSWSDMKQRCYNPKAEKFPIYGGRGIKVCDEWENSFTKYQEWALSNGYREDEGLSIDRIDNDGNYEPSNCRWVDMLTQATNRRVPTNNTTGVEGVYWIKKVKKWRANLTVDWEVLFLGEYQSFVEAAKARQQAEIKYRGQSRLTDEQIEALLDWNPDKEENPN